MKPALTLLAPAALALALPLAAAQTSLAQTSPARAATPPPNLVAQNPALPGGLWGLRSTLVAGKTLATAGGAAQPTIIFGRSTLGGNSGCNQYSGSYASRADVLRVARLASTRRICATAAANRAEKQFLGLLTRTNTFSVQGNTLTLYIGTGDRLTFVRR